MPETLKLLTWLWSQPGGATVYGPEHVRIWAAMIRRHLSLPHTLAVVTDLPGDYGPDVEVIAPPTELNDARIPTWGADRPQCLRRLTMFRRDAADIFGADRIVCTDLDLVVCRSLDSVLDIADDFKITRGTALSRAYNGSLISLRLGSRPQAYEQFTIDAAIWAGRRHIGSDQAWLAHCLPGEKTWGTADGVRFWGTHGSGLDAKVIFFAGLQKPWRLAEAGREAHVVKHYRGDRTDRCLVLGHGETLWRDVAAVLDREIPTGQKRPAQFLTGQNPQSSILTGRESWPFGAVIASPEAAAHWPGKLLAVADDDDHAERLAAMHGFADVVFCGRTERMTA